MTGLPETDQYAWALGKVPELEVDLASAVSALERAQADNTNLKELHSELANAYRWLQEQHERVRAQLHHEQEERRQLEDEQNQQELYWRNQLDARTKDLAELQARLAAPRDADALRLQLAEELDGPYLLRVRELETRLAESQRRTLEAQRQAELLRYEAAQREQELREEMADRERAHRLREEELVQEAACLAEEERAHSQVEEALVQVRAQLREQEARSLGLQTALREREQQSEREGELAAEELRARVEEASGLRKRSFDLQVQLDQAEQQASQLSAELETTQRERTKLSLRLEQLELQQRQTEAPSLDDSERLRAELVQLRTEIASEREQAARAARAAEERREAEAVAARRTESRLKQLLVEREEKERDLQAERDEAEHRLSAEKGALQLQLEALQREAESRRLAWHEREASLVRRAEEAVAKLDSTGDELAQCQAAQEDLEKRLQECQRSLQLAEAGLERERLQRESSAQLEQQQRQAMAERERQEREVLAERERQQREASVRLEQQEREFEKLQRERDQQQSEHEKKLRDSIAQREEELRAETTKSEQRLRELEMQLRQEAAAREQEHQEAAAVREQQQQEAAIQALRQKLEADISSFREKSERLERERNEQASAAEAAKTACRKLEQRCDGLQVELTSMSTKLDAERASWAREADDAHSAALRSEEQKRTVAMQHQAEEHKRQLLRLQLAAKKSLQKESRKRQEQKQKLQELLKKVEQLKLEKQTAVRLCDENRYAYELRLAELTAGTRSQLSAAHLPVGASVRWPESPKPISVTSSGGFHRHELRAISERLERHAEWLKERTSSDGHLPGTGPNPAAAADGNARTVA